MAGSWSNDNPTLIILTEEIAGFSGFFGYSPTVGTGHLVFSVAASAGTDPFGNQYVAGVTVYAPNSLFANMEAGKFRWGQIVAGAVDLTDAGALFAAAGDTFLTGTSQPLTTFTDAVKMRLLAGQPGKHGAFNQAPYVTLLDTAGTSQVDLGLSGAVAHTDLTGAFVPWQTPSLGAGWSFSNIRSAMSLRYRIDGEDNLIVKGSVSCTSTTPASVVFSVVAPYAPTGDYALQQGLIMKQSSAGTGFVIGHGFITSGDVSQNGFTFTSGDIVSYDFTWPLGNLD